MPVSPHPSWAEARLLWDCCKNSYEQVPEMVPDETDPTWERIRRQPWVQARGRMKPLEGVFLVDWQSGKPVDRNIDGVGTFTQRMVRDIPGDRYPRAVVLEDLAFKPAGQGQDWDKIKAEHPSAPLQPPPNGRRFTVAVRGTNTWADKLTDVQLWRDTPPWAMGQSLHRGFAAAAGDIATKVLDALESENKTKAIDKGLTEIRITGHSLGGAVAALLWLPLHAAGYNITKVVTYGQPKVTNKQGAEFFNSRIPLYRFVNERDVVAVIPPFTFNYYHFGFSCVFQRVTDEDVAQRWFTSTTKPCVLRAALTQFSLDNHFGYLKAVADNKNHVVATYAHDHPAAAVSGAAIFSTSPFDAPSTVDAGMPVLQDDQKTDMGETEADADVVANVIRTAGKAEAESGVFA